MDKRARVKNAMDKKPVDHVPVGFWIHFFDKGTVGEPNIQAHREYYSAVDFDFVKVMNDGYFGFPFAKKIERASQLYEIEPIGKDHAWVRALVERVKALVDAYAKDMCVIATVFNPFSTMKCGFADNLPDCDKYIMRFVEEDAMAVKHGLDVVAQACCLLTELFVKEAGCDGIFYSVQNGEVTRFSEAEYRELVMPNEAYVLERINRFSDYNILHCCGFDGVQNHIGLWAEYPSKCVNWATAAENLSLANGRVRFGGRSVLGGFDTFFGDKIEDQRGILYRGTQEEVQDYARNLILGSGKLGLMLGGDCTVDSRIDKSRLQWVVDAARSI
ncbi:MAG: hypothetical protein LBS91_05310 [Clostridiales Family XIII bacterium]|jgi:uroporphyrinogen decarboxylase|nr:hypothetical protein [Clostridiales Family XIII bacterium]